MIEKRGDLTYSGEYYPSPEVRRGNFIAPKMEGPPGKYFKLFYWFMVHQCKEEPRFQCRWDILRYVKKERIDIIHLRRRNLLDIAISESLSVRDKTWIQHHYKGPIEITPQDAEHYMWSAMWMGNAFEKGLAWSETRHLDIWYEDLASDLQGNSDMIADFLQIPKKKVELPWYVVKQRKGRQCDNVINYEELKSHFKDTFYSKFFED